MKAVYTFNFKRPITGAELIEAIKQVAADEFYQELVEAQNDRFFYRVGRSSLYPYKDLLVSYHPGEQNVICPTDTYIPFMPFGDLIYVTNYQFEGQKFAIGYTPEDIVKSVKEFRDKLQEVLKSKKEKKN